MIDDVSANAKGLAELLSREYDVSIALTGEEAVETARAIQPDLILLDVIMPGLSGFEVREKLMEKAITREIPILFVTGLKENHHQTLGGAWDGEATVTKPNLPGNRQSVQQGYIG